MNGLKFRTIKLTSDTYPRRHMLRKSAHSGSVCPCKFSSQCNFAVTFSTCCLGENNRLRKCWKMFNGSTTRYIWNLHSWSLELVTEGQYKPFISEKRSLRWLGSGADGVSRERPLGYFCIGHPDQRDQICFGSNANEESHYLIWKATTMWNFMKSKI